MVDVDLLEEKLFKMVSDTIKNKTTRTENSRVELSDNYTCRHLSELIIKNAITD